MAYSITLDNQTSASVSVSNYSPNYGENVDIFINDIDGIIISDNDVDITGNFTEVSSVTKTFVATGYNGSSSSYVTDTVGHTAENPGSTNMSNWWSSSNPYINFTFDFSSIPEGAEITNVEVKAYGGRESSSTGSNYMAKLTLYTGSGTQKGSSQEFPTTYNQVITLSNPGTWTRSELQGAYLRFQVAYYGGRIHGISWNVSYLFHGYQYTIMSVSANHTIVVEEATTRILYFKNNGSWITCTNAYKKVNGAWTIVKSVQNLFDDSTNYIKGTS